VNGYLPEYGFDPAREGFIVRGPNLLYYPDKADVRDSERGPVTNIFNVSVTQRVGALKGGKLVGVEVGQIGGDVRE
jgi:hypothetical protein